MNTVLNHCYLERRRLTFAGLLAFIAGYALYSHIEASAMGLPFPVFTGLFYMFAVGLAAAATTYCFPKLRRLIDGIAIARVGLAIWVIGTQSYEIVTSPLANATIVVGGAFILMRLGTLIENFSQHPTATGSLVFVSSKARAFFDWLDNAAAYQVALVEPAVDIRASGAKA